MSGRRFLKSADVLVEIGQSTLKVAQGGKRRELALERLENGGLAEACQERVVQCLHEFAARGLGRPRAVCAIGARGVSLRTITLPAASGANLGQLVGLQIESEFPLPPDQLAWGYCAAAGTPDSSGRNLVVVAVKRESIELYAQLIRRSGLDPVFTLGALAGSAMCGAQSGAYAVLDVGRYHSELISFEHGAPTAVRSLAWGGEVITRGLAEKLGITRKDSEKIKIQNGENLVGDQRAALREVMETAADSLASALGDQWSGGKLCLIGGGARVEGLAELLGRRLGTVCERVEVSPDQGSAALAGLRRQVEGNGAGPRLVIQTGPAAKPGPRPVASWKWAGLACVLGVAVVSFRYWETVLEKPELSRRLAELKSGWDDLPEVERELRFFQYLETNQPPYLEELAVVADAAGKGTKIDSLSLDRRGDLSLRGTMPSATQAADFRNKLIESGRFASVVLEEQTPVPNEQKVSVRMSARGNATPGRLTGSEPAREE